MIIVGVFFSNHILIVVSSYYLKNECKYTLKLQVFLCILFWGQTYVLSLRWHVRNVKSHQIYHFSLTPHPVTVLQLHFSGSEEFGGALSLPCDSPPLSFLVHQSTVNW